MAVALPNTPFAGLCPHALAHPVDIKVIDARIGRRAPLSLSNLTRAVYVPWHHNPTTHLPLYNCSTEYHRVIRGAQVGGSEYKTRLCLMKKPTGRPGQGDVGFLVDFNPQGGWIAVSERKLGMGEEAMLSIPMDREDPATIEHDTVTYTLTPKCPLPSRRTASGLVTYPYFTLAGASCSLQWQVHPTELGTLCYVLVDTSVAGGMFAGDDTIVAMYHHANIEAELPTRYSEGMILLHRTPTGLDDAVVVASLMGVLRYVRSGEKKAPRMARLRRLWSRLY